MLAVSLHLCAVRLMHHQGQEIGRPMSILREKEYIDIMATQIFSIIRKVFPPLMPLARWAMSRAPPRPTPVRPCNGRQKPGCGYTTGKPWMKINPNHADINVESDLKNPNSILNFYKELISLRKGNNAIIRDGSYKLHFPKHKSLLVYEAAPGRQELYRYMQFQGKDRSPKRRRP